MRKQEECVHVPHHFGMCASWMFYLSHSVLLLLLPIPVRRCVEVLHVFQELDHAVRSNVCRLGDSSSPERQILFHPSFLVRAVHYSVLRILDTAFLSRVSD